MADKESGTSFASMFVGTLGFTISTLVFWVSSFPILLSIILIKE